VPAVQGLLLVEMVGFPVLVVVLVIVGFRLASGAINRHPLNRRIDGIEVGSADRIVDAGLIPWPNVIDALTVVKVDGDVEWTEEHPTAGENPFAEVLGLKAPINPGRFRPNLMYGERHGRQVFIRLGIDETRRSGFSNRHLRQITVLRVMSPVFELHGGGGILRVDTEGPAELEAMVAALSPSPDVWDGLRVVGGPDGVVADRPVPTRVRVQCQWPYDLWLLERIAARIDVPALPAVRLGGSYRVPYGIGR